MNKEKGFTIIELLVVVAIIAVLAAIVLVNVTQYINKGKDAAIKGNMATILTNSAVYYDSSGSYTGFGADSGYTGPAAAIAAAKLKLGDGTTASPQVYIDGTNGGAFCAVAGIYASTTDYCIDSTGYKGNNSACAATHFACN